jgi:PAS domain S-box-containing protein
MSNPPEMVDPSEARAALEREATLKAILATAVDGIVTIDASGTIHSFNPAAERMFGYAANEVVGKNVSLLMPSPDREQHDQYLRAYQQTGKAKIIGIGREVHGLRRDGTQFPLELSVSEVRLPHLRLFAGMLRDISERRRVEARAAGLGRILDDSHNEIYIFDAQTFRFIQVNRGARDNLGYSLDELRELTPLAILPAYTCESLAKQLIPLLEGQQERLHFETLHKRKDGSTYIVECHVQVSDYESRPVFVAIVLDITDRRQAEERLLQSERLAAIGETVTGLAHESRNAFQRSQACLEMLELELEGRPEELELVARIQRALDHLHHLYEEVRDYAAPINLDRQPCELSHIWRDAWSHLEVKRSQSAVRLVETGPTHGLVCSVDRFAIEQVFRNILENALDACGKTGAIQVSGEAVLLGEKPAIRVSFRDTGPGMDAEVRSRFFHAFFTTKTKGTGLGMAIARRIVEAHAGMITLGDPDLPGAEILVTLPRY